MSRLRKELCTSISAIPPAATIVGFLIGVTSGALIDLSTWWSQIYGRVSEPYLVTFNAVPKLALAPILIIIFGIGFRCRRLRSQWR
jgi:NitT/TauT family transport system permease protein